MGEIKKKLLKIPAEIKYFASDKERIADDETFVITEEHTISDILRYVVECANGDVSEIQCILELLDD